MSNRAMMIIGALSAAAGAIGVFSGITPSGVMLAAIGGAVFGKGYTYWEQKKKSWLALYTGLKGGTDP